MVLTYLHQWDPVEGKLQTAPQLSILHNKATNSEVHHPFEWVMGHHLAVKYLSNLQDGAPQLKKMVQKNPRNSSSICHKP